MGAFAAAPIMLPRERRERTDETVDACFGIADGDEAHDANQIAHLRTNPQPVAQYVFDLVSREAQSIDVDHELGEIESVDTEPIPVEDVNAGQRLEPSSCVLGQPDR